RPRARHRHRHLRQERPGRAGWRRPAHLAHGSHHGRRDRISGLAGQSSPRFGCAILLSPDARTPIMGERVTLQLDSEALAAAREAGIDLSELLVQALRRRLPNLHASERAEAARRWQEENREAIDAVNRMIEEDGFVFSDGARTF